MPPESLEPSARSSAGVSLLPELNLQRIKIVPILRDFTEPSESTRFEPRHHQMWSLLLQTLHAGCDAGTSPLAAPRTTTADLVRGPEAAYGHRPHRVRGLPAETRPNPHLLAAVAIVPEKIPD